MPFGKFKDRPLTEVDDGYLLWLWNETQLREPLRTEIYCELWDRKLFIDPVRSGHRCPRWRCRDLLLGPADFMLAIELVERGRRAAAHVHHPDFGGDHETMARLNAVTDWMKGELLRFKMEGAPT